MRLAGPDPVAHAKPLRDGPGRLTWPRCGSAGAGPFPLMGTAIVTGSGGLIGSESVRIWSAQGFDVRRHRERHARRFFGAEASTAPVTAELLEPPTPSARTSSTSATATASSGCSPSTPASIELVVHTAAQPSHDWAAREPQTDFGVNANGTLNLLEAARQHCPDAPFIFCSTNKVYGDTPNRLPLRRASRRGWSCPRSTPTSRESTPRCRSTARRTRCSAPRRRPPTCWCRSTGATSACRRSAFAAAA